MKVTISSLAWRPQEEEAVADILKDRKMTGVEIVPTKVWKAPLEATAAEIRGYRKFWEDRGIQIVALQSLLFGHPELTIFEHPEKRKATLDYLSGIIRLGGALGAKALVFGSPQNRRARAVAPEEVEAIAVSFFSDLAAVASANQTTLCIEPNPAFYGCDFVTTSEQGAALVRKVGRPGFGLHLDAAGMTLSQEPIEAAISKACDVLCHFHASEVNLAPVGSGSVDHRACASALRKSQYGNWVSIEMRASEERDNIAAVQKALDVVAAAY